MSALDADASPVTTAVGSAEDGVDKAVAVAGDEAVTVKCLAADGREILAFAVPVQAPIAA